MTPPVSHGKRRRDDEPSRERDDPGPREEGPPDCGQPGHFSAHDILSLGFKTSKAHAALLENTRPIEGVKAADYDALFVTGGQSPMVTFRGDAALQALVTDFRPFAVRDGRLVTGQQQNSGAAAARLVIEALGR